MPSSVIGHITYQESRSELTVTFVSGKTYAYGFVPKRVYDDFRSSGAKGNFSTPISATAIRRGG